MSVKKNLQPQVVALDPNESIEINEAIEKAQRELKGTVANKDFLKGLKNVKSKVDSFQQDKMRLGSLRRH